VRISSQALAILGKVFRQMSPDGADLQLLIPPIVQPTIVLRQPTGEQTVNQVWNTSGFFQQHHSVSGGGATLTTVMCTLDKGMWEIILDVGWALTTIPASIPQKAWSLRLQDVETGLGGEISTLQSGFRQNEQEKHWSEVFTFVSPQQLIVDTFSLGASGSHASFTCLMCNRLFD